MASCTAAGGGPEMAAYRATFLNPTLLGLSERSSLMGLVVSFPVLATLNADELGNTTTGSFDMSQQVKYTEPPNIK